MSRAASGPFRNAPVIMISIDTLRADRLPAWGYQGVATPNIDALRADSILFRNAYSHVPLTLPSHVSMLTGLLPADSGVRDNIGYRLDASVDSLPSAFARQGYATGAAVSAYVLRGDTGLKRLFGAYDDEIAFTPGAEAGDVQRSGAQTTARAQQWIDANRSKPFFYFLHLFEPHTPYDAPEPFRSAGADPYDGEIAYVDSLLGSFIKHLKDTGLYEQSIIVLVSDHGEGLGDHGEREHGLLLYREAIHVPLLIKLPKQERGGDDVAPPVGLVDLFATLTSLTGLSAPQRTDGRPILGPAASAPVADRPIFSESMYGRLHYGWAELRSMINAQHHYIAAPRPELYAHASDAREKRNMIGDERRVAAQLRTALEPLSRPLTAPSAASAEEQKKLAALGYLTSQTIGGAGDIDPKDGIAQLGEFESANELLEAGDAVRAEALLRKVIATNPQFSDASIALAQALEKQGRFNEAAETYRSLLASNPALAEQVAIGVATSYLNAGRLGDARKHAELALASNPGGAHLLLGRIALAARDARSAESHARKAMESKQFTAPAAMLASDALMAQGSMDEALRVIDAAISVTREGVAAPAQGLMVARGSILVRLQRVAEAEAAWREEVAAYPRNREAYSRLAALAFLRNDSASGERELEAMVAADGSPAAYALAVNTLRHFGQVDAAGRWARRAAGTGGGALR